MSLMNQSVVDWCSFLNGREPDALAFFQYARSVGCRAAEMVPPQRRAAARAAGLTLLNISGPGMQQGLNRLENHATLLPALQQRLEEAAREGVAWVIVFSGESAGESEAQGLRNCVRGLRQLLPVCDRTGTGLLFEMLNGFDHAGYQATRARFGFSLVEQLGSPRVKVLYDIYHMERSGEDCAAQIRFHLPLIGHFHCAAAPQRASAAFSRTMRYPALIRLALEGGYTGWFGHEFLPGVDLRQELAGSCRHLCPAG